MLRSIAPAINPKTAGKYYFQVFFVPFPWLVSPPGIYGTRLLPLMLLTTTVKEKILFVFICVELLLRALLISGPPSRVRKVQSCKVETLIYAWNARENSLFPKLISQERIR